MRSEPARLGGISLDFAGIPPRRDDFRPEPNRISSTQNFEGLKLLTRRRLGLSHLAEHKFRHNF